MGEPVLEKARSSRGKRGFTRTRISRGEKALGLLLLALIPAATAGIYYKGRQYDPHLFALDPALVKTMKPQPSRAAPPTADAGEEITGALPGTATVAGLPPAGVGAGPLAAPPALPGFAPLPPALPASPGAAPPAVSLPGAPAPVAAGPFPTAAGPDWPMSGPVQRFRPDNLYEKIDGRADQYLKFGVAGLHAATYADRRNPNRFVDVFLYDMASSQNAFGVFGDERPRSAQAAGLGDQGYRVGGSCFFTRGRYYVQTMPSAQDAQSVGAALNLARLLDAALSRSTATGGARPAAPIAQAGAAIPPGARGALPATTLPGRQGVPPGGASQGAAGAAPAGHSPAGATTGKQSAGAAIRPAGAAAGSRPAAAPSAREFSSPQAMLSLFPTEGQVAGSLQYHKQDALGFDFLTDAYTMRYQWNGKEVTLFLVHRGGAAQARALLDKYVDAVGQFGKVLGRHAEDGMHFAVTDVSGFFDAVFQAGPFLGGVNAAGDRAAAEDLAARLLRSVGTRAGAVVPGAARRVERWPAVGAE